MPKLPRTLVLLSFVLSVIAAAFAQVRDEPEIDVKVRSSRDFFNVVVRSNDPQLGQLLRTGFTVHGGYRPVESMREAAFGIQVDAAGAQGVRLTITSGVPEKTLLAETVAGSSLRAAALRAMDRAVFKTSGLPGFFAGKLTFVGDGSGSPEVYTSDIFFGGMLKLTSDKVKVVRPRWSPDGGYIVYTSYLNGYPDIHRLDLRSNRRDVVASFKGMNMGARYSPDGSRMAMVLSGGVNADLWVRDPDGRVSNLTRSHGLEASPSWSPDGRQIVYSSDRNGNQLYVIPSQGGQPRVLPTNISGNCTEPDWNPVDSSKIAFTAAFGSGFQVVVYDMNERKSRQISTERVDGVEPQWLNDGRHIIYTERSANRRRIKIIDTKTLSNYVLSGDRMNVFQASFLSPR